MADLDDVSRSFGGDAHGWNGTAHSTVPREKRVELESLNMNDAQKARSQLSQSVEQLPDSIATNTTGQAAGQT